MVPSQEAKMAKPAPISPREKLECHYNYEVDMLCETYKYMATADYSGADKLIKNALIESFCIHARSLIEFFSKRQTGAAKTYVGDGYKRLKVEGRLETLNRMLNNQIAHLINDLINDKRTSEESDKINVGNKTS
jgi:hypothetical protein